MSLASDEQEAALSYSVQLEVEEGSVLDQRIKAAMARDGIDASEALRRELVTTRIEPPAVLIDRLRRERGQASVPSQEVDMFGALRDCEGLEDAIDEVIDLRGERYGFRP